MVTESLRPLQLHGMHISLKTTKQLPAAAVKAVRHCTFRIVVCCALRRPSPNHSVIASTAGPTVLAFTTPLQALAPDTV